jgi:DNA polymerase-3 subunit delta'
LRSEIVVDDVREIGTFLHLTPAEGGWRIVIIDGADAMNRNAGNALLKILEEPPRRTLLLLFAHSPGKLLPTIRSRCRHLALSPLPNATVRELLARYCSRTGGRRSREICDLAEGSIGRALELVGSGGLELYKTMISMLSRRNGLDQAGIACFRRPPGACRCEDSYRAVEELLRQHLAGQSITPRRAPESLARRRAGQGCATTSVRRVRQDRRPQSRSQADNPRRLLRDRSGGQWPTLKSPHSRSTMQDYKKRMLIGDAGLLLIRCIGSKRQTLHPTE